MKDPAKLRLAMRAEGDFWNAYAAATGTMEGAMLLGSIRRIIVEEPAMKDAFMCLMQAAFAHLLKTVIGADAEQWHKPVPAPQSERAGRA